MVFALIQDKVNGMGPLQESLKQNTYNVAIQKERTDITEPNWKKLRKLLARTKCTEETVCTILESEKSVLVDEKENALLRR